MLAHIASAAYRAESAIETHFGAVGLDLLADFKREGLVEYHSLVTNTVHITAAGRAELKRMREAARARRVAA